MNFEEFQKEFRKHYKDVINVNMNEEQEKQFFQYAVLLREWNEKINLTAITDFDGIILKHFIDSLTLSKYIEERKNVVDVGTGAGFPGIPIKIFNPNIQLSLIDSVNKKIKFLDELIESIGVTNAKTYHLRIEEAGQNAELREQFDICTSRAVAPLRVLLEYQLPLVKLGGTVICMKGPNIEEEIENSKNALTILGGEIEKIEKLNLTDGENLRSIIIVRKEHHTPNAYPRKPGIPSTTAL